MKPNGAKPPVFNFTMKNTTIVVLLCMMILCGCASQRDMITLDNRQALIEKRYFESQHKNKELTTQLNAQKQNNQNLRSQFAEQRAMIESLRQEIQILSGRLEETDYVIKQKIQTSDDSYGKKEIRLDRIDQTSSSNKDRIARIEQYLNFESTEPDLKAKQGAGKWILTGGGSVVSELGEACREHLHVFALVAKPSCHADRAMPTRLEARM